MKLFNFLVFCFSCLSLISPRITLAGQLPDDVSNWRLVRTIDGENTPSGSLQNAVALDLDSQGNIYIVDQGRHRLIKFDSNGNFIKEIGGFGDGPEQFSSPTDVCARRTLNIFVADYNNNRIVRFDAHLNYLSEFIADSDNLLYFEMPLSVAVTGQYDIFVLEDLNKRIIKLNRFNQPLVSFGDASDNLGKLLEPYQLAISEEGEIFVSDLGAKSVVVFDYLGNFLYEIRHPDFVQPSGISTNLGNDLLVVDSETHKIYFFEEGKNFVGMFNVKAYSINLVDVALFYQSGKIQYWLYVLSPNRCWVFMQIKNKK